MATLLVPRDPFLGRTFCSLHRGDSTIEGHYGEIAIWEIRSLLTQDLVLHSSQPSTFSLVVVPPCGLSYNSPFVSGLFLCLCQI